MSPPSPHRSSRQSYMSALAGANTAVLGLRPQCGALGERSRRRTLARPEATLGARTFRAPARSRRFVTRGRAKWVETQAELREPGGGLGNMQAGKYGNMPRCQWPPKDGDKKSVKHWGWYESPVDQYRVRSKKYLLTKQKNIPASTQMQVRPQTQTQTQTQTQKNMP
eukprot:8984121-Pyramimonas_sp.AAC.1